MQELFSSFTARWASSGPSGSLRILTRTPSSHKEILDMEIQFFHERVTKSDPKWLIDRIQRMASGEAPFLSATLSLVYDKPLEETFTKRKPFGLGPGGCVEEESLGYPAPPQASTHPTFLHLPPSIILLRLPICKLQLPPVCPFLQL